MRSPVLAVTGAADAHHDGDHNDDHNGPARDLLTAQGVRIVLTRPDDNGVGPCVDDRTAIGDESGRTRRAPFAYPG